MGTECAAPHIDGRGRTPGAPSAECALHTFIYTLPDDGPSACAFQYVLHSPQYDSILLCKALELRHAVTLRLAFDVFAVMCIPGSLRSVLPEKTVIYTDLYRYTGAYKVYAGLLKIHTRTAIMFNAAQLVALTSIVAAVSTAAIPARCAACPSFIEDPLAGDVFYKNFTQIVVGTETSCECVLCQFFSPRLNM